MRVIIDGDIVAFMASCVERDDLQAAIKRADEIVTDVCEGLFSSLSDCVVYVKGEGNFRMSYDDYKVNRNPDKDDRPATLEGVRQHLGETYGEFADGAEADDYCVIEAQRCLDANEPYVICSIDKDLRQMEGMHYNIRTGVTDIVHASQGYQFLLQQCLTGDAVDGIKGLRGIGPKKSLKLLESHSEEPEKAIFAKYVEHYGDNAYEELKKCYNLVYMRRYHADLHILELPKSFTEE
jgi:5'-3' exonuclease